MLDWLHRLRGHKHVVLTDKRTHAVTDVWAHGVFTAEGDTELWVDTVDDRILAFLLNAVSFVVT
jgi:hypothetical protein